MPIKDLLKTMFHSFFVITTGVTMAMYISCRLLYPDTVLSVGDIGGILLLALFCDLSFLIFASGKELGKKQMAVRFDTPWEVAVFVLLILGVYAAVPAVAYYQDMTTAEKLNDSLRKKYHS